MFKIRSEIVESDPSCTDKVFESDPKNPLTK
jgi:hypothetical protein